MHVRTHTREHLYYCSQCHYSSITKNCLKRHVIQKHSNILLKCPTDGCDYSTPDKYKLQAHLKVHTELVSSKPKRQPPPPPGCPVLSHIYAYRGITAQVCEHPVPSGHRGALLLPPPPMPHRAFTLRPAPFIVSLWSDWTNCILCKFFSIWESLQKICRMEMKQRFHKWHFKELLITGIIIAASKCCWGIELDDWIGLGNCTRSSVW